MGAYQYEVTEAGVITEVNNFIQVNKIYKYSIYNEVDFVINEIEPDLYFITVGKSHGAPTTNFTGFSKGGYGSVYPETLSVTNASFESIESIYNPGSFNYVYNFQIVVNKNENLKKSFLEIDLGYDVKYFESPSKLNFDKPEYGDPNTFEAKTANSGWCLFFDEIIEGDFVPLKIKLLERKPKVTFEVGPNAQPIEPKEYTTGSQLGNITINVNERYEFKGWYTTQTFDEGTLVDETYQVNDDVTLYAKIERKRILDPQTPQECDYFFTSRDDFISRIKKICTDHNNDLSEITLGFDDSVTSLYRYNGIFPNTLIKAPKTMFARRATNFSYCFSHCSSLTTIPSTVFDRCTQITDFSNCFDMCSSLTTIPATLFSKCTKVTNFSYCFYSCSQLKEIPAGLFDNCIQVTSFMNCFSNCYSLTKIPAGLFDKCTQTTSFGHCFNYCKSLTEIPTGLFDKCTQVTRFGSCFCNCSSLATIPTGLFDNCPQVYSFDYCFDMCSSLTTIPATLFSKCTKVTNFDHCFSACLELVEIPATLFDNCTQVKKFSYCFTACRSVTSAIPDAWNKEKFPNVTDFRNYAYECTKASNYADIPADWK